jgi:ribosomal protein L31E
VPSLIEANLERHFLVSVIVHIETERVQALLVEGIRRLGSRVRVHRHRHDRGTRLATEKIEVKEVEPRVFPGDGGVEMMRH